MLKHRRFRKRQPISYNSHIPERGIVHNHRHENLNPYNTFSSPNITTPAILRVLSEMLIAVPIVPQERSTNLQQTKPPKKSTKQLKKMQF
jgi:hypothetical protein